MFQIGFIEKVWLHHSCHTVALFSMTNGDKRKKEKYKGRNEGSDAARMRTETKQKRKKERNLENKHQEG